MKIIERKAITEPGGKKKRRAGDIEREPIALTNDGDLEVVFLGVGSAFATTRSQLNLILIKGDHHVLVDFGMTGPRALKQNCGLSPTDIQCILPTHSHADHIGGLECLALLHRYMKSNDPRPKMILTEEYERILWDCSLRGGLEWNEQDDEMVRMALPDYFEIVRPRWKMHQPREVREIQIGDMHIEMFRTKHIPEQAMDWTASFVSYGLFVDGHVFISMDTRFDHDLLRMYADKSSVMFHDVQFFPGAVHAPLEDLQTIPDEWKQKMWFIHYADNWADQDASEFAGFAQEGIRYIFPAKVEAEVSV